MEDGGGSGPEAMGMGEVAAYRACSFHQVFAAVEGGLAWWSASERRESTVTPLGSMPCLPISDSSSIPSCRGRRACRVSPDARHAGSRNGD
jgi:hypothetical protein